MPAESSLPDRGAYRRIAFDADTHSVHRLEVDSRERSCLVHLPRDLSPQEGPRPLWIALHGGGTCAARMVEFSGLSDLADEHRFIVCYPEGTGWLRQSLAFNAGSCCGYAKAFEVDDVAFVAALIDDLTQQYSVDDRRIHAVGFSNGGMMAHRLASELSLQIAAVASVAGQPCLEQVHPQRVIPVLQFHGTADEFALYDGGVGPRSMSKTDHLSVRDGLHLWVRANHCDASPTVDEDGSGGGNLSSVRTSWHTGDQESVILHTILGGGHTWPGRSSRFPILGPVAMKVPANEILAEFFAKHTLPGVNG